MNSAAWKELHEALAGDYVQEYQFAKDQHGVVIPKLPRAQCIAVPLVREVIAPIVIRNSASDEVTDQVVAGENRIRMIASKTKGVERRRGAQILRALKLGGLGAANKVRIHSDDDIAKVFDLNSFVFGDSAKGSGGAGAIYPVHAVALYSDALSVAGKQGLVEAVFRQGGVYEDGGNFDVDERKSSSNIFTTYTVKPGALLLQTVVFLGNRITKAALDHWLLSTGLAGAYGGGTAVTGTNLRTHFAGVYWGTLERSVNAPGEMLRALAAVADERLAEDRKTLLDAVERLFSDAYPNAISRSETEEYVGELARRLEEREDGLVAQYTRATDEVRQMFVAWFTSVGSGRSARGRRAAAESGGAGV